MKKLSDKLWNSWWFLISVIIGLPLIFFTLLIVLSPDDEADTIAETTTKYFDPDDYLPLPEYPVISIPKYSTFDFSIDQDPPVADEPFEEVTYYVTYSAKCIANDSVGNEWGYGLIYDGEEYESRSHITITNSKPVSIRVFATEYDSDDDYGSAKIDFDSLTSGEVITKEATVTVRENKGRYKGNRAVWEFTVTLERCDRDKAKEHSHNSDPESDSIEPVNRNKLAETPKQISALDVIKCVLCVLVFMAGMLVVGVLPFLYFLINSLVQFVADKFFKADVTESFVKGVTLTILGLMVLVSSIIIGIVLYNRI